MAIKWAVANGNWNAGATWNGGTIPTSDDDVYANNHTVTINVATLVVGSLNTSANADYGIAQSGLFNCNVPASILAARTCDLRFSSPALNCSSQANQNCYISAPLIKTNGTSLVTYIYANGIGWIINSNVEIDNPAEYLASGGYSIYQHKLTINGNILSSGFVFSQFASGNNGWDITLNGNIIGGHENASANQGLSHVTINGNKHYCMNEYDRFAKGGLSINGSVTYESNRGNIGMDTNFTTILNPSTFTWKDVTEPRSNPFIILTDAEMNNRQQYPPEDEVKEGIEYVWGEKVGTYQAPPESVVLKGFVYDNGDKIGTLENEVVVDNTNTINVYPYKRRR